LVQDDDDRLCPLLPHPGDDCRMVREGEGLDDEAAVICQSSADEHGVLELQNVPGPGVSQGVQLSPPGTLARSNSPGTGVAQGLYHKRRAFAIAHSLPQLRPRELDHFLVQGSVGTAEEYDKNQDHFTPSRSSADRGTSGS